MMAFSNENPVSSMNRSITPLGSGGVFTGSFEDVSAFSFLTLTILSDQSSATDGLEFQWSTDGTNVDRVEKTNLTGNSSQGRAFSITIRAQYFRIKYTNGSTNQTLFRLSTIYHFAGSGLITKPLKQSVTDENFAQLVQAPMMARNSDGTFSNLRYLASKKGFAFTSAQTDTVIWTPASGKKIVITGYVITASGSTDADIQVFFGTNSADNWIYNGRADVSINAPIVIPMSISPPTAGAIDESLKLTTNAALIVSGIIFGYEE